jgi:SAM-dependent methyltransferase
MTKPVSSFDRAAGTYLRHAAVQGELARWLAEWLPSDRKGRALEVGAGPGVFTRFLLPWEGPLAATDLSPAMCAVGRKAFPGVAWRTMAAESPDPGPWDWIFSSSMLQWAADPASVFASWRRCLSPGGRVLGGLFAAESLPEWEALAGRAPLQWRTPAQWRTFVREAGLRLLRDEAQRRTCVYPSAGALARSLHRVGAAPERRLPAGKMRRLLADYGRLHPAPGGVGATWTFYRFEAEAGRRGQPDSFLHPRGPWAAGGSGRISELTVDEAPRMGKGTGPA